MSSEESEVQANTDTDAQAETRQRSTVEFPYQDLDSAVEMVKAVHAVGGQSCPFENLADYLQVTASGGGFRLRLLTSKIFGLLNYERGNVQLTALGIKITDPVQEAAARVDAFLTVALYRKVYEQFKGVTLPPTAGLEAAMVSLGVVPKQKDKARQVFQRSAEQANFFNSTHDRLILPIAGNKGVGAPPIDPPATSIIPPAVKRDESLHPFIQGLLKTLPADGAEWLADDRRKWLQAAATIFDLIYSNGNESRTIKVQIEE